MNELYLTSTKGAKWAISRFAFGRWITLHENNPLFDEADANAILLALTIAPSEKYLDYYFPRNKNGERCPTLELMELTNVLDPTNPVAKKKAGEVGV